MWELLLTHRTDANSIYHNQFLQPWRLNDLHATSHCSAPWQTLLCFFSPFCSLFSASLTKLLHCMCWFCCVKLLDRMKNNHSSQVVPTGRRRKLQHLKKKVLTWYNQSFRYIQQSLAEKKQSKVSFWWEHSIQCFCCGLLCFVTQNEYLFMFNLEQTSFCLFLCGLDKSSKRVKKICLKMTANNSSKPAETNSTKSIKLKEHIKKQKGVIQKRKFLNLTKINVLKITLVEFIFECAVVSPQPPLYLLWATTLMLSK